MKWNLTWWVASPNICIVFLWNKQRKKTSLSQKQKEKMKHWTFCWIDAYRFFFSIEIGYSKDELYAYEMGKCDEWEKEKYKSNENSTHIE